ncbi:MAG: AmmeMemoRadiSam system protein A, partial [Alphaproteobacteria bacterium]|nr:AmmeMemoRadiSam system protein A [Alphaproteobacteria bacterium]
RSRKPPTLELETFPIGLASTEGIVRHADDRWPIALLHRRVTTAAKRRPLVLDVAGNAYATAFEDRRFKPVTAEEFRQAALSISILSEPTPIRFADEADLLRQLPPGHGGLIFQDGTQRATFLPQVWQQLRAPNDFLRQLQLKAGLTATHWSTTILAWRYFTKTFARGALKPTAT